MASPQGGAILFENLPPPGKASYVGGSDIITHIGASPDT